MTYSTSFNYKMALGCLSVFASAFAFYLSTVTVKWAKMAGVTLSPAFFVFARFLLGFISVLFVLIVREKRIKVKKKGVLIGRAGANLVAVYCFFKGVDLTSVAQANILNMTYPLFIALFSWLFFKEGRDMISLVIVLAASIGVGLILLPGQAGFDLHSLWGLASGISAAVAIIFLNLSRRYHDTETTLFFLFGIGTMAIFILFFKDLHLPSPIELKYLLLCSFFSIAGQYLITIGFKYVTAIEGGIISSTRILLAALLGPLLVMDPALSFVGWLGAFLIFTGNVVLTVRKTYQ